MADETDKAPADFLDQSEIDKLLAQASAQQQSKQVLLRADGRRETAAGSTKVDAYDFRNPAFLSEVELRRLRLLHEDFIRYLSARLSLFLRMEFGLKMARLTTATYTKFTEALPSPTHICLFKADPLNGVGILDINPRLALTLVDRLLGGRGHSVKAERYLTEIEVALLEDIISQVLEEWCNQWKIEQELHPAIIGHENNGRFLQTSPKDAVMLALALEVNFGDCAEQIQIGVPYYMIEPLVKKCRPAASATPPSPPSRSPPPGSPVTARSRCPSAPSGNCSNFPSAKSPVSASATSSNFPPHKSTTRASSSTAPRASRAPSDSIATASPCNSPVS